MANRKYRIALCLVYGWIVTKTALDIILLQYPQAKQADPNLIIEPSFVKRIDASGFIRALYKN